jgi:hypothetical protein
LPEHARRLGCSPQPTDQLKNWSRERWTWKREVRRDARLSDAAKVLAACLCDDFAHHETGFCAPGIAALAEALGKKPRAIHYALSELKTFGWLSVIERRGRGHKSEITFLKGASDMSFDAQKKVQRIADFAGEKVQQAAPFIGEKVQDTVVNSASYGISPTPPNIDKPTNNQTAPATVERPSPQCAVCIIRGSDNEAAWNEWLHRHRFPSFAELGVLSSTTGSVGWDAPFRMPPRPDDRIEVAIAEKWANWATFRMMEKRSA